MSDYLDASYEAIARHDELAILGPDTRVLPDRTEPCPLFIPSERFTITGLPSCRVCGYSERSHKGER